MQMHGDNGVSSMDRQRVREIVENYLLKLSVLQYHPFSIWKDTELPYAKETIQKALLKGIAIVDERPVTNANKELRRALAVSYVWLANFIPPDDAQLLIQSEKLTWQLADKRSRGERPSDEDCDRLRAYEEPSMKIRAKITKEERLLVAEIAAYNAGGVLESSDDGITLTLPKFEPDQN